jgi:hypothetical protein
MEMLSQVNDKRFEVLWPLEVTPDGKFTTNVLPVNQRTIRTASLHFGVFSTDSHAAGSMTGQVGFNQNHYR